MLEKSPLFATLDAEILQFLEQGTVVSFCPKNTYILNQGEASSNLYMVLEGRVKVFVANDDGREMTLDYLSANETFGELALLDGETRSANVMTVEETKIAMLSRQHFLACLSSSPSVAINMMKILATRLRSMTNQIENLALLDVYGRIARELLKQSTELPDGSRVTCELTHQEIANLVGSSREMVTKILLDLKRGGYIDSDHRRIVIRGKLPARW